MTSNHSPRIALYLREYHEKGLLYIFQARIRKFLYDPFMYRYVLATKTKRTFTFQKRTLHYTYHRYNFTWVNERSMEISLLWDVVKRNRGKNILEIGNVLAHYHKIKHTVLDKYEIAPGVINEDVETFTSKKKYDLIVSVSTFEHVGWDETPRDSKKIVSSLHNLKKLLTRDGKIIFTVPFGYNNDLQKLIDANKLPLTQRYFLKRMTKDNTWKEATWHEVKGTKYNTPFPNGNAVMVGIIQNTK